MGDDSELTRRSFVRGGAGFASAAGAGAAAVSQLRVLGGRNPERREAFSEVRFKLNGAVVALRAPHHRTLLLALREDLGLTGTKKSCNRGHCGACTVLMDGQPIYSCITLLLDAAGHEITTVEGLARDARPHPVQQGFMDRMGSQCGHCTPGMVLSGAALLARNASPSRDEIRQALSGNLCRCGNYPHEIESLLAAAGVPIPVVTIHETQGATRFKTISPALDARDKACGGARYSGDLGFHPDDPFPRPLIAKVLRCPYPHAEAGAVDDAQARTVAGYRGMITFRDVPGVSGSDRRCLNSKARYVGDAVAAVAADNQYAAQRALELLKVEFTPLPPYPNAEYNLDHGIRAIHGEPVAGFAGPQSADKPTVEFTRGDVERGFQQADKVIEGRYVTQLQCHMPSEPHCCTAWWQDTHVTFWDTQQSVFAARETLARALGIPAENVRVVCKHLGGGFGGKCTDTPGKTLYQCIAALLSRKTGYPVRLEFTMKEELIAEDSRNPFVFYLKTGVRKDGAITAIDCKAIQRTGGYASSGPAVVEVAGEGIINTYRAANYRFRGFSVYTNSPVGGEFRGFGHPQAVFARETHMDEVAEAIGMDPVEFRLRNALHTGETVTLGVAPDVPLGNVASERCLRAGMEAIGWSRWQHPSRKTGRLRTGLGARFSQEHTGRNASDGLVWRDRSGRYHAPLGSGNIGTLAHTGIARIVEEALGVSPGELDVTWADSANCAWDFVTDASRSVHCHGKAMYNAALDLKHQLSKGGGPRADFTPYCDPRVDVNPILDETTGKITRRPEPKLSRHTIELARRIVAEGGVIGLGWYAYNPRVQSWGASFAEVEADMETGQVRVVKLVGVHDAGRVIYRPGAEAQIQGGGIMGLGFAMTEELLLDPHNGFPVNQSLYEYRPPSILDLPELVPVLVEAPDEAGPYGAKGLGENPIFDAAAAVANAIFNAAGVRVRELPFTWRRVYEALKRERRLA